MSIASCPEEPTNSRVTGQRCPNTVSSLPTSAMSNSTVLVQVEQPNSILLFNSMLIFNHGKWGLSRVEFHHPVRAAPCHPSIRRGIFLLLRGDVDDFGLWGLVLQEFAAQVDVLFKADVDHHDTKAQGYGFDYNPGRVVPDTVDCDEDETDGAKTYQERAQHRERICRWHYICGQVCVLYAKAFEVFFPAKDS